MGEGKARKDACFKKFLFCIILWLVFEVLEMRMLGRQEENSISVSIKCFKDAL